MRKIMTNPYANTATARLIADRIRDLSHKKTQAEIASEAGFANANMMTFLKNGRNKVPLDRVPSLAKAAVAVGCDSIMIEVHPNPPVALSDGPQQLTPAQFEDLIGELREIAAVFGKKIV